MDAHRLLTSRLREAHEMFVEQLRGVTLEEALDAAGGYRSVLGIAKHTAAWSAVYHSFAFDPEPRGWETTDWPRGLRDRIEPTRAYLDELLAWFERTYERWSASLRGAEDLDASAPLHWGDTVPIPTLVDLVAGHWQYHAGEINAILAIARGEAWEIGEEVEENHISSIGHAVRPPWWDEPGSPGRD